MESEFEDLNLIEKFLVVLEMKLTGIIVKEELEELLKKSVKNPIKRFFLLRSLKKEVDSYVNENVKRWLNETPKA